MITNLREKHVGHMHVEAERLMFKDFILHNHLTDVPTTNGIHTWKNCRSGSQHIASKLDHFLISDTIIHATGGIFSAILRATGSDHWPIQLQWERLGRGLCKPFQFEQFWLPHPGFKEMVVE